jgi:prepilin signal peptidase PulO-like enzyme (type II secretory pathway)
MAAFISLGIILGSFVNALVWRLKKKKNWISERSVCTHCGHTLSPLDLIPVISYIFLGGKCRYCRKKIEDTPLMEVGLGIAFGLSYHFWPYGFSTAGWVRLGFWLVALVLLAAMFLYDLKWMILPDKLTRALLLLAGLQLVYLLATGSVKLSDSPAIVLSVLVGGGVFHVIYEYSKGKYIGGGDVKLGYAYGLLLLDPLLSWMVLAVASLLGSLVALFMLIIKKKSLQAKIPFGPMLIIGLIVVVLFGQKLWASLNTLMLY